MSDGEKAMRKNMIGFKAFDEKLRDFDTDKQFKLGDVYDRLCDYFINDDGFVVYDKIENLFKHYCSNTQQGLRVVKVIATDCDNCKNGKYIAKRINIVSELSDIEITNYLRENIDNLIDDEDMYLQDELNRRGIIKKKAIEMYDAFTFCPEPIVETLKGDNKWFIMPEQIDELKDLKILLKNKDWRVGQNSRRYDYAFSVLVRSSHFDIRKSVARAGYGLDELMYDKSQAVRIEVVKKRYNLEYMIFDKCPKVRKEVAKCKFGLSILKDDAEACVRLEVLKQGYDARAFLNDKDKNIRKLAMITLLNKKSNLIIE